MSEEAKRVRCGMAVKDARAALMFAFEENDRRSCELILTAIESLEEAIDPGKELIETMEEPPNA